MHVGNLPSVVLLVLGVLILAKSIWAVLRPEKAQRLAAWWAEAATKVNTLTGCACTLMAAALWILVLLHQPATHWVLTGMGAVFAWWAVLYFKPPAFQKAIDALVINRTPASLRALSILMGILALLVIGVAVRALL